jgi:archaellum biogenesis ATPase FlaH
VDIFSQLVEPHAELDGTACIETLVRSLKQINATGTTLILTLDPQHLKGADSSALENATDVRLECITERSGGHVDRYIVPRKYTRAKGAVGDVIPFRVEQGAGFIVEIKAVS